MKIATLKVLSRSLSMRLALASLGLNLMILSQAGYSPLMGADKPLFPESQTEPVNFSAGDL